MAFIQLMRLASSKHMTIYKKGVFYCGIKGFVYADEMKNSSQTMSSGLACQNFDNLDNFI